MPAPHSQGDHTARAVSRARHLDCVTAMQEDWGLPARPDSGGASTLPAAPAACRRHLSCAAAGAQRSARWALPILSNALIAVPQRGVAVPTSTHTSVLAWAFPSPAGIWKQRGIRRGPRWRHSASRRPSCACSGVVRLPQSSPACTSWPRSRCGMPRESVGSHRGCMQAHGSPRRRRRLLPAACSTSGSRRAPAGAPYSDPPRRPLRLALMLFPATGRAHARPVPAGGAAAAPGI